jgi:DNA repair exonuclease SbcCD ATPase subunit
MTKLVLKKIRWKNFLSTGNQWTEINLDAAKTTLVVGSNGAGKSTFLDAICFGLFNKPFRNITKPQLVNTITNKDCKVEIEFVVNSHNFKVVRGIKPTVFEIYKNDELVSQEAVSKDYQEAFEKYILRINHKSFCQVFVLGSAIFTPFMALPKGARREIIEDLLDMRIFTTMNNLLKSKIADTEYNIYEQDNKRKLINEKLKLIYEHMREIQESTEKAIQEKQERIDQAELTKVADLEKVAALTLDVQELEAKKVDETKTKKTVKELQNINLQLTMKLAQVHKEITFLETNETCPTCTQVIAEDFKIKTLGGKHAHHEELQVGIEKLRKQYEVVNGRLLHLLELQSTIDDKRRTIRDIENNINNLNRYITELRDDIEAAKSNTIEGINRPTELETDLEEVNNKLENLNEQRTLQGYAGHMLKDTGIKARIIKTYIPIINQLIAKYSSVLDFFVDFQLDEEFEETIKSRFRDVFSYESFSEGEKMRLNLAILFTWRAIAKMRSSIDCNILVFDEVLDSSLDQEGIDNMIKLLQGSSPDTRIFIISHKDVIIDKFERVLQFEKKSNFSRIVGDEDHEPEA